MAAPLDEPLTYPGSRPVRSWQLSRGRVHAFRGSAPADRHAVLGIGSNASPEQLLRKFVGRACSSDLIGLVVGVDGLTIRPSAHLSRSGYWPFAPARSGTRAGGPPCPAALCLLDDAQLAVLDATEPNYVRSRLDRSRSPVSAVEVVPPGPIWLYVSRHGVVDDARIPWRIDPLPSQRDLLAALIPLLPLPTRLRTPDALSLALRTEEGLATTLSRELAGTLDVRPAGLSGADDRPG